MPTVRAAGPAAPLAAFVAQGQRPDSIGEVDFAALPPCHRALLVNDGLTSAVLQAWRLESTRVGHIRQRRLVSAHALLPWLDATPEETVLQRRVVILGSRSLAPLLYAESLWVPARLPASVRRRLAGVGIGSAIAADNLETRRELLWFGRNDGAIASRAYRIILGGVPAFVVHEDFVR